VVWIRDFIKEFCKTSRNFYVFLFYGLQILSKNLRKSRNIFLKKYRHLKSKNLHKFHSLLFVFFIVLAFLTSLFSILAIQTCQKILNNFVVLYYTEYKFYHRILENSWFFIKKK